MKSLPLFVLSFLIGKAPNLAPLGAHWCAALLTTPGPEQAEGEALAALNDTIAKLAVVAPSNEIDARDVVMNALERLPLKNGGFSWGDMIEIKHVNLGEDSTMPASFREAALVRLTSLHDDVTSLKPGTIAFGRKIAGRANIIAYVDALNRGLVAYASAQENAIAARAPYRDNARIATALVGTVPMPYVAGSMVYQMAVRGDFEHPILYPLAIGVALWHMKMNFQSGASYLGGLVSSALRKHHEETYSLHRTRYGWPFLLRMQRWMEKSEVKHALAYLTYSVKLSVGTVDALLGKGELSVDDVMATVGAGVDPKADLPAVDLRYVVFDHILHVDETSGEPTLLMFTRIKKPGDLVAPPRRPRAAAPAAASEWVAGAAPAR